MHYFTCHRQATTNTKQRAKHKFRLCYFLACPLHIRSTKTFKIACKRAVLRKSYLDHPSIDIELETLSYYNTYGIYKDTEKSLSTSKPHIAKAKFA